MNSADFRILKAKIVSSMDFNDGERAFVLAALDDRRRETATVVHAPPNHLARIDALWAFLSVDEHGEGLCAAPIGGMTLPLIAADEARLDSLRSIARVFTPVLGKQVRLVRFHGREELELIEAAADMRNTG